MGQEQTSEHRDLNILLGGLGMSVVPSRSNNEERHVRRMVRFSRMFSTVHRSTSEQCVRMAQSEEDAQRASELVRNIPLSVLTLYRRTNYFEQYYHGRHSRHGHFWVYHILRTYGADVEDHKRIDHFERGPTTKEKWLLENPCVAHLYVDYFVTVNVNGRLFDE